MHVPKRRIPVKVSQYTTKEMAIICMDLDDLQRNGLTVAHSHGARLAPPSLSATVRVSNGLATLQAKLVILCSLLRIPESPLRKLRGLGGFEAWRAPRLHRKLLM